MDFRTSLTYLNVQKVVDGVQIFKYSNMPSSAKAKTPSMKLYICLPQDVIKFYTWAPSRHVYLGEANFSSF